MIELDFSFEDIRVSSVVLKVFSEYINKTKLDKLEYGGILLGRVSNDGVVNIEFASTPSAYDKSGNLYFVRNKEASQLIISKTWKNSNGEVNYIGEWHTHPFSSNRPSYGDNCMIRQAYSNNKNCYNFLIMIIISTNDNYSINLVTKKSILRKGEFKIERISDEC